MKYCLQPQEQVAAGEKSLRTSFGITVLAHGGSSEVHVHVLEISSLSSFFYKKQAVSKNLIHAFIHNQL